MSPSGAEYLRHILDEARYMSSRLQGVGREAFLADETLKRAVVRSLEIIGGAAKRVPRTSEVGIRRSNGAPWGGSATG